MLVTPNFHFAGNCLEAIELYTKAFEIEVIKLFTNEQSGDAHDSNTKNQVYHAEVTIYGQRVFMTDDDYDILSNPLSLTITFDSADQVKNAYEIMKMDSTTISEFQSTPYASAFVSFVDKFGMRWELMTEQTDK
jgi:PhnB protein